MKSKGTITVIGKRWFERTNGNTYHSVKVYLNGDIVGAAPFTYGYDRHYEQTAMEILNKCCPKVARLKLNWLWKVKENGYNLINEVMDVPRKKDLA